MSGRVKEIHVELDGVDYTLESIPVDGTWIIWRKRAGKKLEDFGIVESNGDAWSKISNSTGEKGQDAVARRVAEIARLGKG